MSEESITIVRNTLKRRRNKLNRKKKRLENSLKNDTQEYFEVLKQLNDLKETEDKINS